MSRSFADWPNVSVFGSLKDEDLCRAASSMRWLEVSLCDMEVDDHQI
jgi:hypothetical protein